MCVCELYRFVFQFQQRINGTFQAQSAESSSNGNTYLRYCYSFFQMNYYITETLHSLTDRPTEFPFLKLKKKESRMREHHRLTINLSIWHYLFSLPTIHIAYKFPFGPKLDLICIIIF